MNRQPLFCLLFYLITALFVIQEAAGQSTVSGRVLDSSKMFAVSGVEVYGTSGGHALTDSLGTYQIKVQPADSIYFYYGGKYTHKFPVKNIKDYSSFNISILANVHQKYKLLKPVTVFTPSYRKDSLDNRIAYQDVFERTKPGIHPTYEPGGAAGMDLDALIGVFQFRKNKQHKIFQQRLLDEERENYIDFRFSKKTVSRVTHLEGDSLTTYMKKYRPPYEFVAYSTLVQFYRYILQTAYAFRKSGALKN